VNTAGDPLPLMVLDVHPGREVVRQGERYPDAWTVRSGALLMEVVDAEGHRLALDLLGPGDLVGGPTTWTADASVRALVTSGLVAAGPMDLRDGLARRAHRAAWMACSVAWDRIADRVAIRLEDLAARFGRPVPGGRCLELPLTQEQLAGLTGATRESVNRALAELAAAGRVERARGRYVIRPAGLAVAAAPTPRPAASQGSMRCSTAPWS
jgi:CRP/FNR family transcriptional regulator, cyclic AMP receptor protein